MTYFNEAAALHVVILAAGQGTRMKSGLPKVLHRISGQPLLEHVLRTAQAVGPETITIVIGHKAEMVRQRLSYWPRVQFAVQEPQLGTAHALQQTESVLAGRSGTLILLSGDVPLLTADTLRRLVDTHRGANAAATVVTATVERPYGYGRIVRSEGRIARRRGTRRLPANGRPAKSRRDLRLDLAPRFDACALASQQQAVLPHVSSPFTGGGSCRGDALIDNSRNRESTSRRTGGSEQLLRSRRTRLWPRSWLAPARLHRPE